MYLLLEALQKLGLWWVGLVAPYVCSGTCSVIDSRGHTEKLLAAVLGWKLGFVMAYRNVHLSALLSNARQAEMQLPFVWWLLGPREIAAEILLYSCYIRNAGNYLQTPSLTTLMAIRAWKELIASCSQCRGILTRKKYLFNAIVGDFSKQIVRGDLSWKTSSFLTARWAGTHLQR